MHYGVIGYMCYVIIAFSINFHSYSSLGLGILSAHSLTNAALLVGLPSEKEKDSGITSPIL
jgi:hypothetical protein